MNKKEYIKRYGEESYNRVIELNRSKRKENKLPRQKKNKLEFVSYNSSEWDEEKKCFKGYERKSILVSGRDYNLLKGKNLKAEIIRLLNNPKLNVFYFAFHSSKTLRRLRWTLYKKSVYHFNYWKNLELKVVLNRMLSIT